MINIVTSIAVDQADGSSSLYPQIPFVNADSRRLIYWKCACVFFRSSVAVNRDARHVLVTNDVRPPVIGGLNARRYLDSLCVEVLTVPFDEFKPTIEQSKVFRNNFYKLAAIAHVAEHIDGASTLFDSDVVWLRAWPKAPAGMCLYRAFSRPVEERDPTGISSDDLAAMCRSLDPAFQGTPDWCGGEFIGGDRESLRAFIGAARALFARWQQSFDPQRHRFDNGASIFDNDEFLLSCVATNSGASFTSHLKRIWTEVDGGGTSSDLDAAALHLPNEKLRGIAGLFDELVLDGAAPTIERIAAWCGVPERRLNYRPRQWRQRAWRSFVESMKQSLPRPAYNALRALLGRPPI